MKLIVGLGNPGEEYVNTRHNVGFLVIDKFHEQNNCLDFALNKKFNGLMSKNTIFKEEVFLIKPMTFMNLSGQTVSSMANFYKIDISKDLLVVYDDIDLGLGNIRFRENGSAGTHNGMKSIVQDLGNQNFYRLRIGIETRGGLTSVKQDLHSYVLSKFRNEEKEI